MNKFHFCLMNKTLFCLLILTAGICFSSCTRSRLAFEPTEAEKLTQKEKFALFDYVRTFILSSPKIKLAPSEREFIRNTDPKIRIHYTAPKTGRLNMVWEFKPGRTLSVLCNGPLQTSSNPTDWQINLTSGSRVNAEDPEKFGIAD